MVVLIFGTVFILLLSNIYADNVIQKTSQDFGPYSSSWSEFSSCQGPKAKNLSMTTVTFGKEGEDYIANINFTFPIQSQIDEIKIVVYTFKEKTKRILWSYNVKNPCKHFLFASIIELHLNSHNCLVDKGHYVVVLNITEVTKMFLGPSFFYGDYYFKANILSKKGNILCVYTVMNISKKSKEKK